MNELISPFVNKKLMPKIRYPLPLKLAGVGRYLPKRLITSAELEAKFGIEKGWTERKMGVRERRWVEDETPAFMCAEAAREAIEDAGLKVSDIDLIINTSQSNDKIFPDGSTQVQQELGLGHSGIPSMSMASSCLTYLVAMDIAANFLAAGLYHNILITDANYSSATLDFNKPEACLLMGDGAAAAVVTRTPKGEKSCLKASLMETYGSSGDHSFMGDGDVSTVLFDKEVTHQDFVMDYDADLLHRSFMKYYQKFNARLWPKDKYDHLKLIIPNQANKWIVLYLKMSFPKDKIMVTLDGHGNVGSTGFAIGFYEAVRQKRIERGDLVFSSGAGSGITLAGMVFIY
ncbi:MAG: ketoacyl-ACP synthase III [Desulfobacteraceae bacterium]|jgi:3-oxoacyl-[acyl-carrier-protein] synthase-3